MALDSVLRNIEVAKGNWQPICQDTGTPLVWIHHPVGMSTRMLTSAFEEAVRRATARAKYLRERRRHPDRPQHRQRRGARHPDGALRGVGLGRRRGPPHAQGRRVRERRCPVHAAQPQAQGRPRPRGRQALHPRRDPAAQGKGCAPGIIGACFGGDRGSGFLESKRQLLRPLPDRNPVAELDAIEQEIFEKANQLGIGPMGFGGKTTVIGIKVGYLDRLPASYFVSVSYMCWANRRCAARIQPSGEVPWHA